MYSFENFPANPDPQMRLTPRSYEALLRSGLRIDDIGHKSPE